MSNETVAATLRQLAEDFAQGKASPLEFAAGLSVHAGALEGMDYRQFKESQTVQAEIEKAVESDREADIDREAVLNWVYDWIAKIPAL
jgi:hypothetical protein